MILAKIFLIKWSIIQERGNPINQPVFHGFFRGMNISHCSDILRVGRWGLVTESGQWDLQQLLTYVCCSRRIKKNTKPPEIHPFNPSLLGGVNFGVFITKKAMVISGNSWGEIRRISWNLPQDIVFVCWLTRVKKAQKARAMSSYTYHSWA